MPELAEVDYFRKQWNAGLGRPIRRVHAHANARVFRETSVRLLTQKLAGSTFEASFAHGKNLLFAFSGGHWLGGHLGMTGRLEARPPDARPEKHDHLVLFTDAVALVFADPRMFGRVRFESGPEPPEWWRDSPPEILSNDFTTARVADFLKRRARTPIKTLLLDQAGFPGIGNWMADEICWRLRWHPARLAGEFAERAPELRRALRLLARQALRVIGDDWGDPPDSWLFNHRWENGGRCPRGGCRAELVRADLRGRTTCRCPRCQPGAAA